MLFPVIAHRHPQPEHVGAALLDDVLRRDDVADRLRHLLAVECRSGSRWSATSRYGGRPRVPEAERAASSGTSRDAGRCLRGTCRTATSVRAERGRTASWLDPESNHTSRMFISFSKSVPPHEGHASPAGRNSSTGRSYQASAPCASKTLAAFSTSAGVVIASPHFVQSTAGIGHTPRALARDAPVRAARHHVVDAVVPPRRDPFHVVSMACKRRLAQRVRLSAVGGNRRVAVHADEPLRRREEDDRVMAAPAMRVLMRKIRSMQQPAAFFELLFDAGIRVEDALPRESSTVSRKCPPGPTGA